MPLCSNIGIFSLRFFVVLSPFFSAFVPKCSCAKKKKNLPFFVQIFGWEKKEEKINRQTISLEECDKGTKQKSRIKRKTEWSKKKTVKTWSAIIEFNTESNPDKILHLARNCNFPMWTGIQLFGSHSARKSNELKIVRLETVRLRIESIEHSLFDCREKETTFMCFVLVIIIILLLHACRWMWVI